MRLLSLRPDELQKAVKRRVPLLIAAGVVEFHGPHLPIGTDILMTESLCEEIERLCDCAVAPSLPLGPTMNWAGGPEDGDVDFAPEPFFLYVKETLRKYLELGFKRIYIVHHHAGPEGLQALCLKKAVAELTRETGRSWGAGWGRHEMSELPDPGLFGRITVAGLDTFSSYEDDERLNLNHAGRGETGWIMATHLDTVRLDLLPSDLASRPYWLRDSHQATDEEGKKWIAFCARGWAEELDRCLMEPEPNLN